MIANGPDTMNKEQCKMTEATDLRPLTESEAAHVELVLLRLVRKTLVDGNVQLAGDLAVQMDRLLEVGLGAAMLYVNGYSGVHPPVKLVTQ